MLRAERWQQASVQDPSTWPILTISPKHVRSDQSLILSMKILVGVQNCIWDSWEHVHASKCSTTISGTWSGGSEPDKVVWRVGIPVSKSHMHTAYKGFRTWNWLVPGRCLFQQLFVSFRMASMLFWRDRPWACHPQCSLTLLLTL